MELININKSIDEQSPLLISSCLSLKSLNIHPKIIEGVLKRDYFDSLTLNQVINIVSYDSALEFLGEFKNQNFTSLDGIKVIALANYLLRRIAIKNSFIRDGLELPKLCNELDKIFYKNNEDTLSLFLRELVANLIKIKFLSFDNEVFIYLVVNFYLYIHVNAVLVYTDMSSGAGSQFDELVYWIISWEE